MDGSALQLDLPGFRFHPTEEELLNFYLKNIVLGKKLRFDVIGFLNIYHHEPRDLPGLAEIGEREWYFFVPRDRKQGSGGRPNRTTKLGFWKATGSDRKILNSSEPKRVIGLKKTLVFYEGRAPRGSKTDWVMNEYRLPDSCPSTKDIVLCKIYRKATSMKVLEQRAAMEEEVEMKKTFQSLEYSPPPLTPPMDTNTISFSSQLEDFSAVPMTARHAVVFKKEEEALVIVEDKKNEAAEDSISNKETNSTTTSTSTSTSSSTLQLPPGKENLLELQVPKLTMDWMQDPFWTQLRSPWLDYLTPYANIY